MAEIRAIKVNFPLVIDVISSVGLQSSCGWAGLFLDKDKREHAISSKINTTLTSGKSVRIFVHCENYAYQRTGRTGVSQKIMIFSGKTARRSGAMMVALAFIGTHFEYIFR